MHLPIRELATMEKKWIWPFELEEQLGAGGMGVVYKARYVKNDRRVAVKLLPDHVAANETLAQRFAREMELLKELRHPHIVHCFGGTTEGKQWFYAMELVEGGNIETRLKEKGRLAWEEVIEYGLQICKALEHAHRNNVIHRDLKPANLLLTRSGQIKLADFGLALVADGDRLTAAGKTMGTFLYMSPEQIRGKPPLSPQSDLYSLGCVLFEMLTGSAPFQGENPGQVLHQHVHEPPPRVTSRALDCPKVLEDLILDLLAKSPDDRPRSAAEVATRLAKIDTVVVVDRKQRLTPRAQIAETKSAPAVKEADKPTGNLRLNPWLMGGLAALMFGLTWEIAHWQAFGAYRRAEELWVRGLADTNPAVRAVAAKSIGDLGPLAGGTVETMLKRAADPDASVRVAAVEALGRLGPAARNEIQKIRRIQNEDSEPHVRSAADAAIRTLEGTSRGGGISVWGQRLFWLGAVVTTIAGAVLHFRRGT